MSGDEGNRPSHPPQGPEIDSRRPETGADTGAVETKKEEPADSDDEMIPV